MFLTTELRLLSPHCVAQAPTGVPPTRAGDFNLDGRKFIPKVDHWPNHFKVQQLIGGFFQPFESEKYDVKVK